MQHEFSRRQVLGMLGAAVPAPALLRMLSRSGVLRPEALSGTVSFGHFLGTEFAQNFDPLMAKVLPGIKVVQESTPYSNYAQKILTELAGGTAPDFFFWDVTVAGAPFSTSISSSWNDYLKSQGPAGNASTWGQPFQMATNSPGTVIGLPVLFPQSYVVHIDEELASSQGFLKGAPIWGSSSYDSWNWDQFVEWVKGMTKVRNNGTVVQYGTGGTNLASPSLFAQLVASNGGTLFRGGTPYTYTNDKSNLTDAPVIEAAQMLVDLVRKYKVAPQPSAEAQASAGDTYRSKLAVTVIQLAEASSYPESTTFKQTYMALPPFHTKVRQVGITPWLVNRNSSKQDLARDWIFTWATNKSVRTLAAAINGAPAYDPLPIVESLPAGQNRTVCLVNLSRVKGHSSVPSDTVGVQNSPYYMDCKATAFAATTIGNALTGAFLGKATVKESMSQAKSAIDAQLASS